MREVLGAGITLGWPTTPPDRPCRLIQRLLYHHRRNIKCVRSDISAGDRMLSDGNGIISRPIAAQYNNCALGLAVDSGAPPRTKIAWAT